MTQETIYLRPALMHAAQQMELVLRKHDHKKSWRELPIEALIRKMNIELEEFRVALDFLPVAEARKEIIDTMNFLFFLYDRLGIQPQNKAYVKPTTSIIVNSGGKVPEGTQYLEIDVVDPVGRTQYLEIDVVDPVGSGGGGNNPVKRSG